MPKINLNIDELSAVVDESFVSPAAKSGSRQYVAGEMFYKPGTATDRAVEEMYKVIELDQHSRSEPAKPATA